MAYKQELYFIAVRSDFKVFLRQAFSTIYPGKSFIDNWHIDAIVYHLEQCIEGKMPRLIINLPPRHLKSFIVSVALPAFILGLDPTAKIICISYSDELARALSRDFRRIIESDWYLKVFDNVHPTKLTETEFGTDRGGSRYATSVGGTLTGLGADFILIDDPIKPQAALSDKARGDVNDWYRNTVLSRLDDKEKSVLILVMQRLHVNDLTGFVEAGGGFHKLALPAIAVKDESIPISAKESFTRLRGMPLQEERERIKDLKNIKAQIGVSNFLAQYQQSPETPSGEFFKREHLSILTSPQNIKAGGYYWLSIDSALSTSETADYSALSLGYSNSDAHYVLKAERGRWDYETLRAKVLSYLETYPQLNFIVEAAGSGLSLLHSLRKAGYPHFSAKAMHDKTYRAHLVMPIFFQKRVHLVRTPGHDQWVDPYINELMSFPHGRFDDQVDSLVHALIWAERRVNPGGSSYQF